MGWPKEQAVEEGALEQSAERRLRCQPRCDAACVSVTSREEQAFEGELYELPSNYPHIMNVAMDVPESVSRFFARRGPIPVTGTADDVPLSATLVPRGGHRHRLYLNGETRDAIGKGPGDRVSIRVRFDPSDRMPTLPVDLEAALRERDALAGWQALRPSQRKEYLVVLADAKRSATRARRIARIVQAAIDEGTTREL